MTLSVYLMEKYQLNSKVTLKKIVGSEGGDEININLYDIWRATCGRRKQMTIRKRFIQLIESLYRYHQCNTCPFKVHLP